MRALILILILVTIKNSFAVDVNTLSDKVSDFTDEETCIEYVFEWDISEEDEAALIDQCMDKDY